MAYKQKQSRQKKTIQKIFFLIRRWAEKFWNSLIMKFKNWSFIHPKVQSAETM